MKKYGRTLLKIKDVNASLRWKDLRQVFDKLDIKYKCGSKHSLKVYLRESVWTLHVTKDSIPAGAIKILKDIMIKEKYLDN